MEVIGRRRQWPVRIRLPDGQPVVGWLQMWSRGASGWYCLATIPLWDTVDPVAGRLTVAVPATHVEPLDGVDYTGVPVARGLPEPEAPRPFSEWQGDGPPPTGRGPAHD